MGKQKKDKMTNTDLQNITQKKLIEQHERHNKPVSYGILNPWKSTPGSIYHMVFWPRCQIFFIVFWTPS